MTLGFKALASVLALAYVVSAINLGLESQSTAGFIDPAKLGHIFQRLEQDQTRDIAVVFSGGGVRASLGTIAAVKYLKEKDLLKRAKFFSALSGGTWGLTAVYLSQFDPEEVMNIATRSCRDNKKWFDFGFSNGCKDRCHEKWTNAIDKYYIHPYIHMSSKQLNSFVNPNDNSPAVQKLGDEGKQRLDTLFRAKPLMQDRLNVRRERDVLLSDLTRIAPPKMPQPIFMTSVYEQGKTRYPLQCAFSIKGFCHDDKVIDLTSVTDGATSQKLLLKDWLGFSSSAWLEVPNLPTMKNYPLKLQLSPVDIKQGTPSPLKQIVPNVVPEAPPLDDITVSLGDSGVDCNLPMAPLFWIQSRVKTIILFDFTDPAGLVFGAAPLDAEPKRCFDKLRKEKFLQPGHYKNQEAVCDADDLKGWLRNSKCSGKYAYLNKWVNGPQHQNPYNIVHIPLYINQHRLKTYKKFPTIKGLGINNFSCDEIEALHDGLFQHFMDIHDEIMSVINAPL